MESDEDGSSSSSGSENKPAPSAARSVASVPKGILTLAISYAHSRACKCCLCGSKSTDPSPLVSTLDEAATEADSKRPWAKYRKVVPGEGEEPVRVPEGRLCLPCLNVFRLLGREGRVLQDLSLSLHHKP